VTDAAGTVQPGAVAWDTASLALVWAPQTAFVEGATYQVTVLFDNETMGQEHGFGLFEANVMGAFALEVRAATTPTEAPRFVSGMIEDSIAYETYSCPDGQLICDDFGSCSPVVTYQTVVARVTIEFTNDAPGAPYVWYRVYADRGEGVEVFEDHDLYATQHTISIQFVDTRTEYCLDIEAIAIDGTSAMATFCFADADRTPLPPAAEPEPFEPDCQDPPIDVMEPAMDVSDDV